MADGCSLCSRRLQSPNIGRTRHTSAIEPKFPLIRQLVSSQSSLVCVFMVFLSLLLSVLAATLWLSHAGLRSSLNVAWQWMALRSLAGPSSCAGPSGPACADGSLETFELKRRPPLWTERPDTNWSLTTLFTDAPQQKNWLSTNSAVRCSAVRCMTCGDRWAFSRRLAVVGAWIDILPRAAEHLP